MSTTDLLLMLASFLALVYSSNAIKCHVCETSIHNDTCADPYESLHLEECKEEDFLMCYKLVTIRYEVGKSGDREERNTYYSRFCGHKDDSRNKCAVREGFGTMATQCGCTEDGCNTASIPVASLATVAIGAIVGALGVVFL